MAFDSTPDVLVVWLHFKAAFEDGEVYHERITLALDDVAGQDLIRPWISQPTIVVFGRKDVCLDLVICQLTCVEIDGEIFLESPHLNIVIDVFEELLVADADLSVYKVGAQLELACLLLVRQMLPVELI